MDQHQVKIIQEHPLSTHLDTIRDSLHQVARTPADLDTASREDLQTNVLALLSAFLNHPASRLLSSRGNHGTLREDLARLIPAAASNTINLSKITPLFSAVLADPRQSDVDIWEQVYDAVVVAESTPPRKPASSFQQTPFVYRTASIMNSSERRTDIDKPLRDELGVMYVDVLNFHEAFFGNIPNLETSSKQIFQNLKEGEQLLFRDTWIGWPELVSKASVLTWLAGLIEQIKHQGQEDKKTTRRLITKPHTPVEGSVAQRKLDVGFVDVPEVGWDKKYYWS
ncbi:hypothetical protein F5Y16DRAFT_386813 [Xylariaceae sp. FL0255]|nr:hypothetical protein F5Y16DRAFT_386813 [Xylariaceae sp. FL0255]